MFNDLTGKRFGRLTALCRVEIGTGHRTMWHCRCDCGRELDVDGAHLRQGKVKSCGCVSVKELKPGVRVRIADWDATMKIMAMDHRYLILTAPDNRDGSVRHFAIDFAFNIRGKITPELGDFRTEAECQERLRDLQTGRSRVWQWLSVPNDLITAEGYAPQPFIKGEKPWKRAFKHRRHKKQKSK